jgi:hypothetical protein
MQLICSMSLGASVAQSSEPFTSEIVGSSLATDSYEKSPSTCPASGSLLAGRCQAEAARNGLRPLLVKSRFMRTERTQNCDWSEVPLELISYKYLTRTTFRN